jgi:hypothetical protein
MGIAYTLIKGIPANIHLDSFEVRNKANGSYREVDLNEYLAAYESYIREPSDATEIPEIGRNWKGLFTDAKRVVLQEIAFTGEPFVHQRGRYDCLSPEVAEEFEERLLLDVTGVDWERVFRFKADRVDMDEPIGLISILEHPAMGPDNSYNAREIFKKLVQRAVQYEAELLTVYGRGDFAKNWPFRETESGLVVADRSHETCRRSRLVPIGTAPDYREIASIYARIIPPKESLMFFSFTAYNNELLGDGKEVPEREAVGS